MVVEKTIDIKVKTSFVLAFFFVKLINIFFAKFELPILLL